MDAIKFGLLLIVFLALNLTLPAQKPMSEPEVQRERKISRPKKEASLSGVILEYNPLTQTVDTLDPNNSDLLGLTIRRKKGKVPNAEEILPIIIIQDGGESRFIKYVFDQEGVKSISADDYIFSGTGYICLSPDIFPISKNPEHADLVFIAKNDWYFYEKIGDNTARQLNALRDKDNVPIKKLYRLVGYRRGMPLYVYGSGCPEYDKYKVHFFRDEEDLSYYEQALEIPSVRLNIEPYINDDKFSTSLDSFVTRLREDLIKYFSVDPSKVRCLPCQPFDDSDYTGGVYIRTVRDTLLQTVSSMILSDVLSRTIITFKSQSIYPTVEDINDNLNKTRQILQNNSSLKLIIEVYEGIYDKTSKEEEVQARELARQRSVILRDFFLDFIPPEQIETACYAVSDPQAPVQSELKNGLAIFRIVKR